MFVNCRMEHEELHKIFEEDFGNRLLINPHLPANMDFSCPDNMATPNSFKCEQKLDENKFMLNIHQNVNRKELTTEQLLNFVPKSQLNSPGGLLTPSGLSTLQALSSWNTINPFSYETSCYPVKQEHPPSFPSFIGAENELNSDFSVPKLPSTTYRRKSAVPSIPLRPSPLSKAVANDNSSNSGSSSVGIQHSNSVSQGKRRSSASASLSVDSSNLKDEARWKTWSRIEEVFLVGAVMDRFFKRGSLSSTRGDDVGTDDCWSFIKATYDKAWTNFAACGGKQIPQERSMNALSRHYKVMKARISQADMNQESIDDFRVFFDEWETVYNVNNCLLAEGQVNGGNNMPSRNTNDIGIDFRKRKVRLSVQEKPRLWDENNVNRRSSLQSESSHASHSSNSSFLEEGGYAIRQEQEVTEEYY